MKQLKVPFLPSLNRDSPVREISRQLNWLERNAIDVAPWPTFSYKPTVKFAVAHNSDCLFVKFYVEESAIRATYRNTNDPVYRDSCVELFIAFHDEKGYYNLEFNSLGTCLAGYGSGKTDRTMIPETVSCAIRKFASLKVGEGGAVKWELALAIPVEVFCFHDLVTLFGLSCRVNFYKCGDDLPEPHYLSWNNIKAAQPNFHLPEYFGELQFL